MALIGKDEEVLDDKQVEEQDSEIYKDYVLIRQVVDEDSRIEDQDAEEGIFLGLD